MQNIKTFFVTALLGVLVIVGVVYFYKEDSKLNPENNTSHDQKKSNIEVVAVDTAMLPNGFPGNIPLEKGAEITLNMNVKLEDNRLSATREFVSAKSISQNFEFYSQQLKALGWTITKTADRPDQKVLIATKDGADLNIRCYGQPEAKTSRVAITHIAK